MIRLTPWTALRRQWQGGRLLLAPLALAALLLLVGCGTQSGDGSSGGTFAETTATVASGDNLTDTTVSEAPALADTIDSLSPEQQVAYVRGFWHCRAILTEPEPQATDDWTAYMDQKRKEANAVDGYSKDGAAIADAQYTGCADATSGIPLLGSGLPSGLPGQGG